MEISLAGKVVLITGATSGIGKALALRCAQEGAKLALCGRSVKKAELLKHELEELNIPGGVDYLLDVFSVRDKELICSFMSQVFERFGTVDYLVNNAGLNSARGLVEDIQLKHWQEMMEVNVEAPLIFCQQALPCMKQHKQGMIINVLSTVCLFSSEKLASYTASKAACQALTGVLRKECRPDGIKVLGVYPGGVNTDFRPQERPEYMTASGVAYAICAAMKAPNDVAMNDLVLRPLCESNMA